MMDEPRLRSSSLSSGVQLVRMLICIYEYLGDACRDGETRDSFIEAL